MTSTALCLLIPSVSLLLAAGCGPLVLSFPSCSISCGEMSFIRPRPLLMQYLPLYSRQQFRRHNVMPGFSSWAQINGRNSISWEEKFRLDVWYVDHQSFWLDIRILLHTIWKVIRREGINASGETTMAPFTGSTESV